MANKKDLDTTVRKAVRQFIQHNVPGGDTFRWGSQNSVTLTMNQIERMTSHVTKMVEGNCKCDCECP